MCFEIIHQQIYPIQLFADSKSSTFSSPSEDALREECQKNSLGLDEYFLRIRDESQPRLRICFDPEQEIPLLQKWFHLNNHPSRLQVKYSTINNIYLQFLQVEQYTDILNSAPSRMGRPKLDVHNIIYWFKNTRAALRRAETRQQREEGSMRRLFSAEMMR